MNATQSCIMDSGFEDAVFMGEPAQISLSSSFFLVQSGNRQLQLPTANIVAIHMTDSEKVSTSQSRIHAAVLVVGGDLVEDHNEQNHDPEHSFELKSFGIEFKWRNTPPFPPLFLPYLPDHLLLPPPENGQANIHVIISTLSGTQKAEQIFDQALEPLLDKLKIFSYDVHRTESQDTISQLTRDIILPQAKQGVKQLIILLSGDGGMFDVVNTLLSEKKMLGDDAAVPIVALIPVGTGNALFNSSCRPRPRITRPDSSPPAWNPSSDQTHGLRTLLLGRPKPLPTFQTRFSAGSTSISYSSSDSKQATHTPLPTSLTHPSSPPTLNLHGTVLTSCALHASLVSLSDSPTHRLQGPSRFTTAAQSLLYPSDGSSTHLYRGVLSTLHLHPNPNSNSESASDATHEVVEEWIPLTEPDGQVRREHIYILLTLVSNLEENFTISPHSEPLDGRLRLVSIGAVGVEEVVRVLGLAYHGGRHVEDRKGVVGYEEVEGMRIQFEEEDDDGDERGRWRRVCVDGMIVECPRGGWVEVRGDRGGRGGVDLVTECL